VDQQNGVMFLVNASMLQIGTGIATKNGLQGSFGSGSPLIELVPSESM
jgi:hypothetical protein